MITTDEVLKRIDKVLHENRRLENVYIILTVLLFFAGTGCFITAMFRGNFAWATPSVITTGLLHFPLREIRDLRLKNIALATAPVLITQLPSDKAAEEIIKLLNSLYQKDFMA